MEEFELFDDEGNLIEYNITDYKNIKGDIGNLQDKDENTYTEIFFNTSMKLKFDKPVSTKHISFRLKYIKDKSSIYNFRAESYVDSYWTNSFDNSSLVKW